MTAGRVGAARLCTRSRFISPPYSRSSANADSGVVLFVQRHAAMQPRDSRDGSTALTRASAFDNQGKSALAQYKRWQQLERLLQIFFRCNDCPPQSPLRAQSSCPYKSQALFLPLFARPPHRSSATVSLFNSVMQKGWGDNPQFLRRQHTFGYIKLG